MENRHGSDPCTIVIYGGSGDLALRMLLPSLYHLDHEKLLPGNLQIIGAGRSPLTNEAYVARIRGWFEEKRRDEAIDESAWARFARRISYLTLDATHPDSFHSLAELLKGTHDDVIHYLATAPGLYGLICENLAGAELAGPRARVVLEKPIGHDLETSREINDAVSQFFPESHIFRVDHYLGKETVQNLLALRFANMIFEPMWNHVGIDHVQITVSEQVGVDGRRAYFDETGALRDMVQSHMLQLLCLVAMEPPSNMDPDAVRNEKIKVMRSLRPISPREVTDKTVRGQYTAGTVEEVRVPGYADEDKGRPSATETFVALRADIDNWRWAGVPFYLRTGKRMPARFTEIFIQFRKVPHSIFAPEDERKMLESNKLIIRLQPEENITLRLMNKIPGLGTAMELREVPLNLSLTDAFQKRRRRIAYERLLLDLINGRSTLFVRRDEVEAAWSWIDGIIKSWEKVNVIPKPYAAGTWGPSASIRLTERNGHTWHEQL